MKDVNENWEFVFALQCEAAFTGASMTAFTLQAHIKYASVQMSVCMDQISSTHIALEMGFAGRERSESLSYNTV